MNYLNTERFSVDEIADELFDFSKLGALSVPGFLTEGARAELLHGIQLLRGRFFTQAKREVGPVIQEMSNLYLENIPDLSVLPPELRTGLARLADEYGEVYRRLAARARFASESFNSLGIHLYPKGSVGITPHQDYKADSNLIASFVIEGRAPFFICKNRQQEGSVELDSTPGSLILMRAARDQDYSSVPEYCLDEEHEFGKAQIEKEQLARPFHYLVGPLAEDRYSIIFRYRPNGTQLPKL